MKSKFKKIKLIEFLTLLPEDWAEELLQIYDLIADSTEIYGLVKDKEVLAGGMVFSSCPPDLHYVKSKIDVWFEKGYKYIGFLFVNEQYRGHKLGSKWLASLKDRHPNTPYLLTIEEEGLKNFYIKNNFEFIETLHNGMHEEWLLATSSDH